MSECRSCHALITWAVTVDGKRMPLDYNATDDGTLVVVRHTDTGTPVVRVVSPVDGVPSHPSRYRSHFATCPDAGDWRKR
jgi:hypothetical protein